MRFNAKVFIELDSPNMAQVVKDFGTGTLSLDDDNTLTLINDKNQEVLIKRPLKEIEAIWVFMGSVSIGIGNPSEVYGLKFIKPGKHVITLWDSWKKAKEFKNILISQGFVTSLPKAVKTQLLIFISGSILMLLLFIYYLGRK